MSGKLIRKRLFIISYLLLVAGLMACGPAAEDSNAVDNDSSAEVIAKEPVDETAEDTPPDPIGEESVEDVEPAEDASVDAEPEMVDEDAVDEATEGETGETSEVAVISVDGETETYNGLTVGFTESGHPFIGDPEAPVLIEEYSDYQCPYCKRFYTQSMSTLKTTELENGDAKLVFYDFPLSFHAQAAAASNAARCAGEHGAAAYWTMHDRLFDTLGEWSVPNPIPMFIEYAADIIGVDVEAFTTCANEDRYTDEIKADEQRGRQNGITGTPGFLINGELLSGAQPYQAFAQAVNLAMGGESIIPEPEEIDVPEPQAITLTSKIAFAMGDPDAKVRITEFSDLQCPYCARYTAETFPSLLTEHIETGRVYYEFRDLPLDQIHPLARVAAVAARCAGEQDKYLELHDLLFARQGAWGLTEDPSDTFATYATELGLDATVFTTCLTSGKFDQAIEDNFQEAMKYQIGSTPYFVVNGFPVLRGAQPFENFENVIKMVEEDRLVDEIKASVRRQMEAQQQQQAAQPTPTPVPNAGVIPEGTSFILGEPDAPITIVEYTDYQCPFCQRHFSQTFPQIKANYIDQGLVRYVFKDFPLDFHPEADEAAVAAHCAQEQNLFLEMHTALFEDTQRWGGQPDVYGIFTAIATEIGADGDAFIECVGRGEYEAKVSADLGEGSSYGVRGTPAFFINGEFVNGAQPYTVFASLIDSLLPTE